jgi:hypothetical protein
VSGVLRAPKSRVAVVQAVPMAEDETEALEWLGAEALPESWGTSGTREGSTRNLGGPVVST